MADCGLPGEKCPQPVQAPGESRSRGAGAGMDRWPQAQKNEPDLGVKTISSAQVRIQSSGTIFYLAGFRRKS